MLWRLLIAAICVALVIALIPPVLAVIGLSVDPNLLLIIRICAVGIAIFYVLRGPNPPWPT